MFSIRCQQMARSLYHIQSNITNQSSSPGGYSNRIFISTSRTLLENYYESLGIPANSTQNDIKAAYYKLSMIYHPDKNQGSESAAKKFREISQAYEVLSNYRLRRLYDKGIIHTAGSQYAQTESVNVDLEEEDDPQTKFYKSRLRQSAARGTSGQAPIYDFDAWARAHYGKSFDRKQNAKQRYDRKQAREKECTVSLQNEKIIFGLVIGVICLYLFFYSEKSYDTPKPIKKKSTG